MNDDTPATQPYDHDTLPPVIARYLDLQHPAGDRGRALGLFAADAHVRDEGIDYRGQDEIHGWLTTAASEFTYTTTYTGQSSHPEGSSDGERWLVGARLEGDFPGGVADLRFRFTVDGDRIVDLVIAP